ncbi:hypothetical protein KVT40_007576 [Elsinoe batatas]|uniref:Uncharacterized protein n=1 Tax=Elsinoe batatas TaxID=2601811 RepID=A0A8K0PGE7_9PEZI|nr:hypothetical protein KVT40_007576 [Elsinoe batatas]
MLASLSSFFTPSNLTPHESSHEGVRTNIFTSTHPPVHHSIVMFPSSSMPKHNARSHPPATHSPHHPSHPRRVSLAQAAQVAQQDRAAQDGTQSPGVGPSGTGPVDGDALAHRLSQWMAEGGASSAGANTEGSGPVTPTGEGGTSPVVGKGSPGKSEVGTPMG